MCTIGICGISVAAAAVLGMKTGNRIPEQLKAYLMCVLSILCFIVAITSIQKYANLLPVSLALILGGLCGGILDLAGRISRGAWGLTEKVKFLRRGGMDEKSFREDFACIFSIVCLSGAGIMGSIVAGATGDTTILVVKAMMDFPVAYLYGARLGAGVCLLALPEILFFGGLFLLAQPLSSILSPDISGNLYACGGAVILASAFSMAKIQDFRSPNLMPAMVLVIPFSMLLAG